MPNGIQMLQNFAGIYGSIQALIFSLSLLFGAVLFLAGLMKLRKVSANGDSPGSGFAFLISSTFLFSLASTMTAATQSMFSGATPMEGLAYTSPSGSAIAVLAQVAVGLLTILGWVAGFSGLYQISHFGGHQANPGLAIKLCAGGAMAVNFVRFAGAITGTLGIGTGWESTLGL